MWMWKRATGSCYMLLSKQEVSQDGRSGRKKKKKTSSGFVERLYNEITKKVWLDCMCVCVYVWENTNLWLKHWHRWLLALWLGVHCDSSSPLHPCETNKQTNKIRCINHSRHGYRNKPSLCVIISSEGGRVNLVIELGSGVALLTITRCRGNGWPASPRPRNPIRREHNTHCVNETCQRAMVLETLQTE